MMLWVHVVRRRWKAREVKEADMAKAARGLFPPKGDKIEEIWVDVSTRPIWHFQNQVGHTSGYLGSTYSHSFDLEALDRLSESGS